MTKFFKAKVAVQKIVDVHAYGENEEEARRRAGARAQSSFDLGSFQVAGIELVADGETDYMVGMQVKHRIFGTGTIMDLRRSTNGFGHQGFTAAIQFDEYGTKAIGLPLPKDKLEILLAK